MTAPRILIIAWPLIVSGFAWFFKKKQNGKDPWTGGPISWPKSFWLAYTVSTWFFLPIVFLTLGNLTKTTQSFFYFHLLSWWLRGPLELIMIYKWFNWSPRYGITHDLSHFFIGLSILICGRDELSTQQAFVTIFMLMILFGTLIETLFAFLFLRFRSKNEEHENIYFASDDPKWKLINRISFVSVTLVMIHLVGQSVWILFLKN